MRNKPPLCCILIRTHREHIKRPTVHRASLFILALALLAGCGGGSSSSNNSPGTGGNGRGGNGGGGGGGGGGSTVGQPTVVNVSSGLTASGVDVQVPAPAA